MRQRRGNFHRRRLQGQGYCAANGVDIQVTQCKMLELHDKANDYDLVVTSGKFKDPDVTTPCIMAIALLTGINEEATLQQIVDALKA